MRIHLQHVRTKKFLREDGGWESDRARALGFNDIRKAHEHVWANQLRDVQVLLRFRTNETDLALPLPREKRRARAARAV